MKNISLLALLILFCKTNSAQNIFTNPDFEQYTICPVGNSEIQKATDWLDVVYSSDYVNCIYNGWTPQAIIGAQNGLGYAGFATYGNATGSAESFGQWLATPLVAGNTYNITFFAKRSNGGFYSQICTGVCFWGFVGNPVPGGPLTAECTGNIAGANLLACSDTVILDTWQQYSVTFTATGNYDYVVISPGCALNCPEYIYIDNISFTNSVTFQNTCLGDSTWFIIPDTNIVATASWNFGDPASGAFNTSTALRPYHIFTSTGTFLVRLIRVYQSSFVDTTYFPVTIVPCGVPQALFNADTLICPGTCVSFNNLSVNSNSYQWIFSGGNPASDTAANPQNICYNNSGSFDVQLIASNGSSYDTLLLTNYISVYTAPVAPTLTQSGDTLFAQQGYATYQWYLVSDTINGATNYFYVAQQSGNYNLVVTDEHGCSVGAGIVNVIASLTPTLSEGEGIQVFPNPSTGKFEVKYYSEINSLVTFEVINSLGEIIFKEEKQMKEGTNSLYFGEDWGEAIYLLKISSGEKYFSKKLTIVH